jgi:hypothetical protein
MHFTNPMTERLSVLYFTLLHKPDMRIFAVLDPNRRISDKSRSPNPEKSFEPPAVSRNFFFGDPIKNNLEIDLKKVSSLLQSPVILFFVVLYGHVYSTYRDTCEQKKRGGESRASCIMTCKDTKHSKNSLYAT